MMGGKFLPPPYKCLWNFVTLRSYFFIIFQQITFKLGNFTNFKVLFLVELTDFSELVHVKSWKKLWKGLLT